MQQRRLLGLLPLRRLLERLLHVMRNGACESRLLILLRLWLLRLMLPLVQLLRRQRRLLLRLVVRLLLWLGLLLNMVLPLPLGRLLRRRPLKLLRSLLLLRLVRNPLLLPRLLKLLLMLLRDGGRVVGFGGSWCWC